MKGVKKMEFNERQKEIHDKGFSIVPTDYSKLKLGLKSLAGAITLVSDYSAVEKRLYGKRAVIDSLIKDDLKEQRRISNYYYRTNGLYKSVCNYIASLYRYDWYVVPEVLKETDEKTIIKDFNNILRFFDNSHIKQLCGNWALDIIVNGVYYGYKLDNNNAITLQDLPPAYCRSRYKIGNRYAIEFNMKFFDDEFPSEIYREKMLKLFPKDFQVGYGLYKAKKLQEETEDGVEDGWYLLDPDKTVKFSLGNGRLESPFFITVIPSIIDLENAQELDRKKQMQKLLKIIVQKLPRDKNGDLIFDGDEARDIHETAVNMVGGSVGTDVLTTFADIDLLDLADNSTSTTTDELEKNERTVYNGMGISKNIFNTDGNLSLQKSIQEDEAAFRDLLFQFHTFFDDVAKERNFKKDKYYFKFYMLETTQYNYIELSKMFKEQVQIGYS